jgi:hypothetical protein
MPTGLHCSLSLLKTTASGYQPASGIKTWLSDKLTKKGIYADRTLVNAINQKKIQQAGFLK